MALIVVADDDPTSRSLAAMVLELEGHKVVAVESGAEVLELCFSQAVDAVVMDFSMPIMNGDEAAARLRAEGYGGAVLLLSGHDGAELAARGGLADVDDHLAKPFDPKELCSRVAALLGT